MSDILKTLGSKLRLDLNRKPAADVEKRAGLYIKRPVLNGQDWYDWAVKYGIPSPVAADDLHVTIIYSSVDVKVKPERRSLTCCTSHGAFRLFGEGEDALVVTFGVYDVWSLQDRHYFLQNNGATSKWPSFRPHMTLSYEAAGFEISDAALQDAPDEVILGGEVFGDVKADFVEQVAKSMANPEGFSGADLNLVDVTKELRDAAKALLKTKNDDMDPMDVSILFEVANSAQVRAGVLRPIDDDSPVAEVKKTIDVDFKLITAEVAKELGLKEAFKANEAEQMVVVIASVAKHGDTLADDLHGDQMTAQALTEYSRDIIRGTRAGQFNHNGDNRFEVVQSFNLDETIQKSLGIDLGFEPLLMEIHIPDSDDWAEVMDGEWGVSIRGTMFIEGPAE